MCAGRRRHARPGAQCAQRQVQGAQSRLLFGVGIVKNDDGTLTGHRCEALDYSGQWVETITKWEELVAKEMHRVKTGGEGPPWVVNARPAGLPLPLPFRDYKGMPSLPFRDYKGMPSYYNLILFFPSI